MGAMDEPGHQLALFFKPSGGMGGQLLTITANGSDTASSMKEKKTRSWQDISLGDVLASIGRDNNLKTKVTDRFKSILFDQLDQTGESDINFIERLARDHDALGKVVGDILVFSQRNSGINASGQPLKTVSLGFPGNVSSWRMSAPGRQKFAQVSASWYDVRETAHKIVTAGSGQPVQYLEKVYPSEATAREAAQSKLKASQRGDSVLTLSGMVPPGSLMLVETPLNITGLRKGVDGRWRVNQVSLSMTTGGFTYSVQAVRPE
ncbi:MAG: hypothetical protein B0D91_14125 [Oceanospirillales bacterium LUC14_002_19_P2]|nr:MAG: hypothetical protein B0D91_14125 [Oceanospirillales bacterium LUC14_002_19_P2]